jgi:hypothetical protein
MKDPLNDPDVVGYCGLIVLNNQMYQGFIIHKSNEALARTMLNNIRTAVAKLPLSGPQPETLNAFPGLSDADQKVLGPLTATLVECALKGRADAIGGLIGAVRLLTGKDFFMVRANDQPGGVSTTVVPLDVETAIEAREKFQSDPSVIMVDALRHLSEMEPKR